MPPTRTELLVVGISCQLIVLMGFVFACFALTGIRKRGPEKVAAPAMVGLVLNGLILVAGLAVVLSIVLWS